MPPLVSIIVPCFNHGDLLECALNSIQMQTMRDWECVIVDDGSTDNTSRVSANAKLSDSRIVYVRQENRGLASARNTGIQNSSGKFIQLLDADDLIEHGKLEAQATYLEKTPSVDVVYGNAEYFNHIDLASFDSSTTQSHERWSPKVSGAGSNVLNHIVRDNFLVVSAPMFRRELVKKNGAFDESLTSHEDWDFWLRCALGGARFQFLEASNTRTLIRVQNKSMSSNRLEMYKSNLVIRKQLVLRLPCNHLKAINFERSLSMLLGATRVIAKSNFRRALKFGIANWPRRHGVVPALVGICKFIVVTLKTSRFSRNRVGPSKQ